GRGGGRGVRRGRRPGPPDERLHRQRAERPGAGGGEGGPRGRRLGGHGPARRDPWPDHEQHLRDPGQGPREVAPAGLESPIQSNSNGEEVMNSDADNFWDGVAGKLRKAKKFCPLSPEEAEAAFDESPEIPTSEAEIEAIVESVVSGEPASWEPLGPQEWD